MKARAEQLPVRFIQVTETTRITPHMTRVSFGGDDLADLALQGPDQQVKLYFPRPGQQRPLLPEPSASDDITSWYGAYTAIPEEQRPWMRSYTIRAHRPRQAAIDVDFVLHPDAGPATRWALAARPGDTLGMFGPSPAFARPVPLLSSIRTADWLLLAGDETALPAIGTLIESLPEGTLALAYVEIGDERDEQHIDTRGRVTVTWLHRGAEVPAGRSTILLDAIRDAELPDGAAFAWLGGEAGAVRALRRHLVEERGIPKRQIDFSGYWRSLLSQDDPPTQEDLDDAGELAAHAEELAADLRPPQGPDRPLSRDTFDEAYRTGAAPWVIGEPQPAIVELERDGWIRGTVLDAGCGTGENTIHLARLGYDVVGVDYSAAAIDRARANAERQRVAARFQVADLLDEDAASAGEPTGGPVDTVVDSALFHVFGGPERARYVHSLHRLCRPGAVVHILALSDQGPGYGPVISDTVIREAFTDGWSLEELRTSRYRGVVGTAGEVDDLPAWLARIRRL